MTGRDHPLDLDRNRQDRQLVEQLRDAVEDLGLAAVNLTRFVENVPPDVRGDLLAACQAGAAAVRLSRHAIDTATGR